MSLDGSAVGSETTIFVNRYTLPLLPLLSPDGQKAPLVSLSASGFIVAIELNIDQDFVALKGRACTTLRQILSP